MEKKLKSLFDYQRFEKNSHLAKRIEESETRFAESLSDESLGFVNAAGGIDSSYGVSYSKEGDDPSAPTDAGNYSVKIKL